jgi:hypothetical protein
MDMSRWLSLSIAIIYILFFGFSLVLSGEYKEMSTADIFEGAIGLIFWLGCSLGCIWFGDELGEGMVGAKCGLVSSPSPGWAVKLMGWILLLLLAGIFIWFIVRGVE